jgi:hypothetical protein
MYLKKIRCPAKQTAIIKKRQKKNKNLKDENMLREN